jgi:hypothetical protein
MTLTAHALEELPVRLKSVRNEGHFTLEAELFIVRSSPCIAVWWFKEATRHTQRLRKKEFVLG